MAEKRMFTQKIIDSDAFLDMPLSSQALYFHLNMRADDDGFVNNPKRIQRTIGASEDDLKLLVVKRFVIGFESGVLVIKHWRMHNTLRKDRYNPTQYQDELRTLDVKDNNAYTERIAEVSAPQIESVATSWQPNGNQMATQYSVLENSIVENSVDKESTRRAKVDYDQIKDLYNDICISLPRLTVLSDKRKKAIKARLNAYTIEQFTDVFKKAQASAFLTGSNQRNWQANFDWLIRDANFAKVLDGNYDSKRSGKCAATSLDIPEYEKMVEDYVPVLPKTAADDASIKARADELKKQIAGGDSNAKEK